MEHRIGEFPLEEILAQRAATDESLQRKRVFAAKVRRQKTCAIEGCGCELDPDLSYEVNLDEEGSKIVCFYHYQQLGD